MLTAGLSEFILIGALVWAGVQIRNLPLEQTRKPLTWALYMALSIIGIAASFGAIRYLNIWDSVSLHKTFSYFSRHLAMPCLALASAQLFLYSGQRHKTYSVVIKILTICALINLITSTWFTAINIISDALFIISLILWLFILGPKKPSFNSLLMALIFILSTLIWPLLVSDISLRIGIFHICLAAFFIGLGLTYKHLNMNRVQTS